MWGFFDTFVHLQDTLESLNLLNFALKRMTVIDSPHNVGQESNQVNGASMITVLQQVLGRFSCIVSICPLKVCHPAHRLLKQ